MIEVTEQISNRLRAAGVRAGICHVYVPHTTAGVIINENVDRDVCADMLSWLDKLVPRDAPFRHAEGNSPAHIKASLVGQSATVPIEEGRLALGTWQGVYLAEFDGPRERTVIVSAVAG